MNERDFLKELKSKANKDRDLTPAIIEGLLSEGQALAVKKRFNILSIFFRRKSASQIIEDNLEAILDRTTYSQLNVLLESLMKNWQTSEIVKEKFEAVMKRFNSVKEEEQEYKDAAKSGLEKIKFYKMCRKTYTYADDLFVKHMDAIIQGRVTIEELKYLRGLSQEADEKLNRKLESEKQEVAREMLQGITFSRKSEHEVQGLIQDYLPTVKRMVEELLVDQNARMVDIEKGRRGGYSQVYHIGEKVLKIGQPRETYKIPNHPRILQPLTRTNLLDERDGNKVFACVEISDRADQLEGEEDLQVEKLYQLYKELRDDGIIWTDARFKNVGKLRQDNIPKLNGENMNVDPQAVGMDKEIKERRLKAGDWVIFDLDYLYKRGLDYVYREEDSSIVWPNDKYCHSREFEQRWQQEREGKVVAQYQKDEASRTEESSTKSYELRSWEKGKLEEEER